MKMKDKIKTKSTVCELDTKAVTTYPATMTFKTI